MEFKVVSSFEPSGDQPGVIENVARSISSEGRFQAILGATGTGKTYVMAKIIESVQRPAVVICHNKTLAAQLYKEFKSFFPYNAVEYFVSYYDYYQPEAYVAKRDLYIEKDSAINDEIDKLRLRTTASIMERKDVLIVASVSCIYGLGSPEDYSNMFLRLEVGSKMGRGTLLHSFVNMLYERNDTNLSRGKFRVRGDVVDIYPSYEGDIGYRIEFFGDEIEKILSFDILNNKVLEEMDSIFIYPAKHFVMGEEKIKIARKSIEIELEERCRELESQGKKLEKERLYARTKYDLEMLENVGTCAGIENYSRHFTGKNAGEPPWTLLDYFPDNFVTFIDESHVTIPQLGGMYNGDKARKQSLVDYGFRLPSALDNRPLRIEEFLEKNPQMVFISATLGPFERERVKHPEELIIRPTGLLDPMIEVRPTEAQVDDIFFEIKETIKKGQRILVTTLTKKMAEDLSEHFIQHRIKAKYLHSDIDTIERVDILMSLRRGEIDVIVGINLLREGLDIPEVSLVAIFDADKIGFLRSKTSLLQTVGRAARNVDGRVIMYADKMTDAMRDCIDETQRRREIQAAYNQKHGITPKTIVKNLEDILDVTRKKGSVKDSLKKESVPKTKKEILALIKKLEYEMEQAADQLEFEKAIAIRDEITLLRKGA